MLKRGQITVFIVLGIIVLALTLFIFAIYSQYSPKEISTAERGVLDASNLAGPVKSYVESCIRNTAKEGILENGYSGGYFTLPERSTIDLFYNVPYYKGYEQDYSPSDEVIASELGKYVDVLLNLCLDDFQPFKEQGYNITAGKPSSAVKLSPTKFSIETTFPLAVTLGTTITEISSFHTGVPAEEFYSDLEAARLVANSTTEMICTSCFSDLAAKNELFVEIYALTNNTYLFEITDNDYEINYEKFRLRFAVRYNESSE